MISVQRRLRIALIFQIEIKAVVNFRAIGKDNGLIRNEKLIRRLEQRSNILMVSLASRDYEQSCFHILIHLEGTKSRSSTSGVANHFFGATTVRPSWLSPNQQLHHENDEL